MDAAADIRRNPVVSEHHIQSEYGDEQANAGRDCRTRPARRPNSQMRTGTGKYSFSSADHEQDWQPHRLIYTLAICDDHHGIISHEASYTLTRQETRFCF